jgi:hypothetical protein
MAKAKDTPNRTPDSAEDLLKKILITQLCIARVPQREIAKIVGMSLGGVNAIAKYVKLPNE